MDDGGSPRAKEEGDQELKQSQSSAQKTQPDDIPPEDDILKQIEQTLKDAENEAREKQKNTGLPDLGALPNLNDL